MAASSVPTRRGLGVGMDLPWGAPVGFDPDEKRPTERVRTYLDRHAHEYAYCSFSFQPRGTVPLRSDHYRGPYQRLNENLPAGMPVALHQTILNLGSVEPYDRTAIYEFTNELHRDLGWAWVVEDLGIWSLKGTPLPYPLPPYLVRENIDNVTRNIAEAKRSIDARLHVEFPGFTDGVTVVIGDIDAYDFFREVVVAAEADVTLDVGHLLSWRWWQGMRGADLYKDLEKLPLEHCRELHLAGSAVHRGRFLDLHHGVLMEEQLVLTEELLSLCPRLEAVTYEDPSYDREGQLVPKSVERFERLRKMVEEWQTSC